MNSEILFALYGVILGALVMLVRWEFLQLRKGPTLEAVRRRLEKKRH